MNNEKLQSRKTQVIARGQGNVYPVYVERAKNAEIWDVEGHRYIDFGTGIAVCNTGHSHPKVIAAAKAQLDNFSHTCLMVNPYEVAVELAEKLTAIAPGNSEKKAIFVTTGAEAVENCVKIARAHTGRRGVIAFNGGFHGRTNLTMALTGKITPYKNLFGPFPGDIFHAPFPIACHDITVKESLKALENLFKVDIAPTDVAAIIVEPVQGEGGFYQAPSEFLQALRTLCDQHGIVLIADEIQTGFGRTGKMFAYEHANIQPDFLCLSKGLTSGWLPLSAVLTTNKIYDAFYDDYETGKAFLHSHTYSGNALAASVAVATLNIIQQEKLCTRAQELQTTLMQSLQEVAQQTGQLHNLRGIGAMVAADLLENGVKRLGYRVYQEAVKRGALLRPLGNTIYWLPPLNIQQETLAALQDITTHAINSVCCRTSNTM